MITQPINNPQKESWKIALINAIESPLELLQILQLDEKTIPWQIDKQFKLRVPRGFVNKMKVGDPNDPLLRQVLPTKQENLLSEGFSIDPLQELKQNPLPGIIHKFKNRVLLTPSGSCAINCRYCFRRYFPYRKNNPSIAEWQKNFSYIQERPEINEVILSGGDPLMVNNRYLEQLINQIEMIPHVKYLRIHSRLPIVIPQRINDGLLTVLNKTHLKTTLVLHCNHPNELCNDIKQAVTLLKQQDITVFNQSVLLKGVNDNLETLSTLSYKLYDHGILPYYVHVLDPVQGTQHFFVEDHKIQQLVKKLPTELPGFLLPRIVREIPNKEHKIQLF